MIRKAIIQEKHIIMKLINNAINDMDAKGIYQWDDIYPDEKVIEMDLNREELHVVLDNGIIKGIIVLNEFQDEEYKEVEWQYKSERQLMVHRLCVHPQFQGMGIARQLMKYAEEYGKASGYEAIRLDSFTGNKRACKLYESLGYKIAGMVNFRKGSFLCLEKFLKE